MMFGAFGTLIASRATAGATKSRDKPVTAANPAPICSKLRRVVDFVSRDALPPPDCPPTLPRPFVDPQGRTDLLISLFRCNGYTADYDHGGTQLSPTIQSLPDCASLRKFMKRWVVS